MTKFKSDMRRRRLCISGFATWLRWTVQSEVLTAAAKGLMKLYLESGDEIRVAIETGFLEHALETAALRPYFEQWGSDPRLEPAWKRALEWGDAHPDYMAGLFQRLQKKIKE